MIININYTHASLVVLIVATVFWLLIKHSLTLKLIKAFFILIGLSLVIICALTFADPAQFLIILLPVISSYIFAAYFFKELDLIGRLNAAFVILACEVIAIAEALSLFKGLTGVNFLFAAAVFFLISILSAPKIKVVLREDRLQFGLYKERLSLILKESRLLALFLLFVLISIFWRILLIIYVPPNNYDSMLYHLSRVAFWMQNHSISHYNTACWFQTANPHNAEVLVLWTMISSKLDRLAGFIQFTCYMLSGTLVYACVRGYLKKSAAVSLTAALAWYSLTEAVLESTSTQNDMVAAYFTAFAVVFALTASSRDNKRLFLSAVSFGLAIGVKTTTVFMLIPFLLFAILYSIKDPARLKRLALWIAIFSASFAAFSSFNFIQNYNTYGDIFGPAVNSKFFVTDPGVRLRAFCPVLFQNLFTLTAGHAGLGFYSARIAGFYNTFTAEAGRALFNAFHITANVPGSYLDEFVFDCGWRKGSLFEDIAFFGIAGPLIVLSAVYILITGTLKAFVKKIKFDLRYLVFAFLFTGYLALLSYFAKWTLWLNRYFITSVLVSIPMLALIFDGKKMFSRLFGKAIILCCIFLLIPATFMNDLKPVTALNKDRTGFRCLGRESEEAVMRRLDIRIPSGSKIGLSSDHGSWYYPIFGEGLKNTVIVIDAENVKSEKFDFIIIVEGGEGSEGDARGHIEKYYVKIEDMGSSRGRRWILYGPKK